MIQSFQRQVLEEQMAKTKQREQRTRAAQGSPTAESQETGGSSPNKPNLFLKNNSSTLPPRRMQLAVSQVGV